MKMNRDEIKAKAKAEKKAANKLVAAEFALVVIVVGILVASFLAAVHLMGVVKLPDTLASYVGAALLAYMLVGFVAVVHFAIKNITKKG